jgi:hypothetical protein
MKRLILAMCLILSFVAAAKPIFVFAASYFTESATEYNMEEGLKAAGKDVFPTEEPVSLQVRIGQVIQALVALVGVIFLAMVVIGGIQWLMSGGGPEIQKAQSRIVNATIGLLITVLAYAAVSFVISNITKLTQPEAAPAEETK